MQRDDGDTTPTQAEALAITNWGLSLERENERLRLALTAAIAERDALRRQLAPDDSQTIH